MKGRIGTAKLGESSKVRRMCVLLIAHFEHIMGTADLVWTKQAKSKADRFLIGMRRKATSGVGMCQKPRVGSVRAGIVASRGHLVYKGKR